MLNKSTLNNYLKKIKNYLNHTLKSKIQKKIKMKMKIKMNMNMNMKMKMKMIIKI
jgi:hypothetical protein